MAHRIVANGGQCCPCEQRAGCECECQPAVLACRQRGGTAELCGHAEFAAPSAPPRRYRSKALSGTVRVGVFVDAGGTVELEQPAPGGISPAWFTSGILGGDISISVTISVAAGGLVTWSATQACPPAAGQGTRVWIHVEGVQVVFVSRSSATASVTHGGTFGVGVGQTITVSAGAVHEQTGLPTGLAGGEGASLLVEGEPVVEELAYGGAATHDAACSPVLAGTASGEVYDAATGKLVAVSLTGLAGVDDARTRFGSALFAATDTAMTHALSATAAVVAVPTTANRWRRALEADLQDSLTEPDTEASAISRLLAAPGGAWDAWESIGLAPAGCLAHVCCLAIYAPRTAFAFAYTDAQWRVSRGALTPGTALRATVDYYRRAAGATTPGEKWAEGTSDGTVEPDGTVSIEGDIPNTRGWETWVGEARLCAVPEGGA